MAIQLYGLILLNSTSRGLALQLLIEPFLTTVTAKTTSPASLSSDHLLLRLVRMASHPLLHGLALDALLELMQRIGRLGSAEITQV
ncbi:unnamed protein product [Protopolystoma xenopodis]|uniref:Uncharacterized protein n=1 Tax=Protopolystoma xenopodis TaxID=117903 RepID=A0A3S5AJY3_9PLAT|nr:unnamed protein product [Protopolystoma xenopodis]